MYIDELNPLQPSVADVKVYAAHMRDIKEAFKKSMPEMSQARIATLVKAVHDEDNNYDVGVQIPTVEGTEFMIQFDQAVGLTDNNLIKSSNDMTTSDWDKTGEAGDYYLVKDQPGVWGDKNGAVRFKKHYDPGSVYIRQTMLVNVASTKATARLFVKKDSHVFRMCRLDLRPNTGDQCYTYHSRSEPNFGYTGFREIDGFKGVMRPYNDDWFEVLVEIPLTGATSLDLFLYAEAGFEVVWGNCELYEDHGIEEVLGAEPNYTVTTATTYAWDTGCTLVLPDDTTMPVTSSERLNREQVYRARVNAVGTAEIQHTPQGVHPRRIVAPIVHRDPGESRSEHNCDLDSNQITFPNYDDSKRLQQSFINSEIPGWRTVLDANTILNNISDNYSFLSSAGGGTSFSKNVAAERGAFGIFVDDTGKTYITDYHDIGHD